MKEYKIFVKTMVGWSPFVLMKTYKGALCAVITWYNIRHLKNYAPGQYKICKGEEELYITPCLQ